MAGMPMMPKKMMKPMTSAKAMAGKMGKSLTAKTPMAKGEGKSVMPKNGVFPAPPTSNSTRDVSSPTKAKSAGISQQQGMPTASMMKNMKSSLKAMG